MNFQIIFVFAQGITFYGHESGFLEFFARTEVDLKNIFQDLYILSNVDFLGILSQICQAFEEVSQGFQ